jgi:hypothetical protein
MRPSRPCSFFLPAHLCGSPLSLLSLANRRAPPVGLITYLKPDSGLNPSPTEARAPPPPPRRPGSARQGPLGHPIKPPPRALGPAKPAAAALCLANPSPCRRLRRRTSAAVTAAALPLLCCRELLLEFRRGVRVLAGLFSPSLSPSRRDACLPSLPHRASPSSALSSPRRLVTSP